MTREKRRFTVRDYRGREFSIVELVTIRDDEREGEIESSSTLLTVQGDRVQAGKTSGEYWIDGIGATSTAPYDGGPSDRRITA